MAEEGQAKINAIGSDLADNIGAVTGADTRRANPLCGEDVEEFWRPQAKPLPYGSAVMPKRKTPSRQVLEIVDVRCRPGIPMVGDRMATNDQVLNLVGVQTLQELAEVSG